jgi:Mg-chelatase subunit ChlD
MDGMPIDAAPDAATLRRWRLILGPDAGQPPDGPSPLSGEDARRDAVLEHLYRREHLAREEAGEQDGGEAPRRGGQGVADPRAVHWLGEVRQLFPRSAAEVLQRDALSRYGMQELLADPEVLAQATPSIELVATLMALRHSLPPPVLEQARLLVARVVRALEERLAQRVRAVFSRRRRRAGGRGRAQLSDLDWQRTLRHNLRHYQADQQQLVLERLFFHEREAHRLRWDIWLVVDQSGSMFESAIHSAVMASIFARVRALQTHMLLFADEVVDATHQLHEPEALLLGAQLGGGTRIGAALAHVAARLATPRRSVVVLISDLYEGPDEEGVLYQAARLIGSGARVLVLPALDRRARPDYDRDLARRLAQLGAHVAAMTPDHLVDWLARTMKGQGA